MSIIAASRLRGFNGFLNQFTGSAFGASLRLLDKDYTDALISVRAWNGSADQGQADIMPYAVGSEKLVDMNSLLINLDATALGRGLTTSDTLADLVDAGGANYDGFVPTIYEQLNGDDFNQPTALRQGNIVTSGVLNTENGKPIIHRSANNSGGYLSTYTPNGTGKSLYYVGDNNGINGIIFSSETGDADFGYFSLSGSSVTSVNRTNVTVSNEKINGASAIYSTRGDFYNLADKQFLLSNDIDIDFQNNILALGYRFSNPVDLGMYSFQEFVLFDNQLDRVAKETNINNAFSIF
jgi:hypothetical protein